MTCTIIFLPWNPELLSVQNLFSFVSHVLRLSSRFRENRLKISFNSNLWFFQLIFYSTWNVSISFLTLKSQQQWNILKILFCNMILPKVEFSFKSMNQVMWSQNIFSRLCRDLFSILLAPWRTFSSHKPAEQIGNLLSAAVLHLQSTKQNLEYYLLEIASEIYLPTQTTC